MQEAVTGGEGLMKDKIFSIIERKSKYNHQTNIFSEINPSSERATAG